MKLILLRFLLIIVLGFDDNGKKGDSQCRG